MKVWRRIQYAFRSRRNEADLAEELAHHQALKQQEYESSGMSRADATFAAHRAIGNAAPAVHSSQPVHGAARARHRNDRQWQRPATGYLARRCARGTTAVRESREDQRLDHGTGHDDHPRRIRRGCQEDDR